MTILPWTLPMMVGLLAASTGQLWAEKEANLTQVEEDKLREAQDPSERIQVYLAVSGERLDRFQTLLKEPADPQYDYGAYLDGLLGEYIVLNEELKDRIEDYYQHDRDMRRGLRALLEWGPRQLAALRRVEESPNPYAPRYAASVRDAKAQLSDMLEGAAKALAGQEKKFAEVKREEKAAVHSAKERAKEQARRTKEEEKLRKRQRKGKVPGESDED